MLGKECAGLIPLRMSVATSFPLGLNLSYPVFLYQDCQYSGVEERGAARDAGKP